MLLCAMLTFGDSAKPVCNSQSLGTFWPESANSDRRNLYALSHTGELELCTRGFYKYRWQSLTVSYQELLKAAKAKNQNAHGQHQVPETSD